MLMKLSQTKKTIIFIGLAIIVLAYPIGFFGAQLFVPTDCTGSFLPSICTAGTKVSITVWTTIVLLLVGSLTTLVAFIKKK